MVKELPSPLDYGDMRKLAVRTDPTNEYSTRNKQIIHILDHPKNLIEVLRARLTIYQGLTGNNITTELNQYLFTRTFLDGEALHIFDLKSTELRHETVANLILVMDHVATYFGPKYCLSKQKCYIRYKIEKPRKLTKRQYVGLVFDLNSRMAQMPPLFDENQQQDESELVDSLANKAPVIHKAVLISQVCNPETGVLKTFVEHCKRVKTTDNIAVAKFPASDKYSDTKSHKKRSKKFKEREENGKKHRKKNSSLYFYLHGENKIHTSEECTILKARAKDKDNHKYEKKGYKKKFK